MSVCECVRVSEGVNFLGALLSDTHAHSPADHVPLNLRLVKGKRKRTRVSLLWLYHWSIIWGIFWFFYLFFCPIFQTALDVVGPNDFCQPSQLSFRALICVSVIFLFSFLLY